MKFRFFFVLLLASLLVACGGGGGDAGGPRFSVSTNQINVGVTTNSGTGDTQSISGTMSNYNGPLYIYITHTSNGISSISYPIISGNTGTSSIFMQPKIQGVYFDTITVEACSDAACANQLPGSPQLIDVTYSVGIAVDPPVLNFTAAAGSAPLPQTVTVYYIGYGNPSNNWASSYLYLDGNNWMSYLPFSNSVTPTEVEVTVDALPIGTSPGVYNAEIRFGANEGRTLVTLPIHYTIN